MNPFSHLSRHLRLLAAGAVLLALSPLALHADEPAKWDASKLTKDTNCKLCHGAEKTGNQWKAMADGPHAKAFAALSTDKAKEIAKAKGVADPTTSGACLSCHSTAYGFTDKKVTELIPVDAGVTCQACHGPGAEFMSKHATNKANAIATLGLIVPTEANTCSRCHNDKNPTYNPERYTTKDGKKVDFDFEQAKAKIPHPLPAKK